MQIRRKFQILQYVYLIWSRGGSIKTHLVKVQGEHFLKIAKLLIPRAIVITQVVEYNIKVNTLICIVTVEMHYYQEQKTVSPQGSKSMTGCS